MIREAAAKAKVATQMGTQIHASDNYRRVVELIQSGAIGPVREAHVWVGRAWGWQSEEDAKRHNDIVCVAERPDGSRARARRAWTGICGSVRRRSGRSTTSISPGPKWYRWWDFGNGTMSDLGSHWNDLPFWALKLQAPLTIEASGPPPHPEIAPASMSATYEYGARGDMPAGEAHLVSGREQAGDLERTAAFRSGTAACLFIGDKACCSPTTASTCCCRKRSSPDSKRPDPSIPRSPGHHAGMDAGLQDRQADRAPTSNTPAG